MIYEARSPKEFNDKVMSLKIGDIMKIIIRGELACEASVNRRGKLLLRKRGEFESVEKEISNIFKQEFTRK